jgi:hypothetical protein
VNTRDHAPDMPAMNSPVSGSPWKPSADSAAIRPPGPSTVAVADLAPRPRQRRRLAVAAIVVGVLAVTGAGAAAIGHAVAGTSNGSVRTGPDGDGPPLGGRSGHRHGPDGVGGTDVGGPGVGGPGVGAGVPAAGTST